MSTPFRLLAVVGILAALLMPLVARADLATPDTIAIESVHAWKHMLQPNDVLMLVMYDVSYGNKSAQPAQPITQTFTFTYSGNSTGNVTTVLGNETAYPFMNLGYLKGVVAFYWADDDPLKPTWGDLGNVSITGTSLFTSPPSGNYTLVAGDWTSGTQPSTHREDLRQWLLNALIFLELDWNNWGIDQGRTDSMVTLIQTLSGTYQYASPSGEAYLGLSISGITTMCPLLFTGSTMDLTHTERDWTLAQQSVFESIHQGDIVGNATEALGDLMGGVSRIWASTLVIIVGCLAIIIVCTAFWQRLNNGLLIAYAVILLATPEGLFQMGLMALFAVVAVIYLGDIFLSKRGPQG
jgi:hypothetical protein